MPFGRLCAEAVLEALEKGVRQRDFRQQDQHLPALVERRGDRLEIDLGLARAGDAVDQRDADAALLDRRAQRVGDRLLVGRQFRLRIVRIGQRRRPAAAGS